MKTVKIFIYLIIVLLLGVGAYYAYVNFGKKVSSTFEKKAELQDRQNFSFKMASGKIEIRDDDSGKVIQRIGVDPLVDEGVLIGELASFKYDVNFDGFKDLIILTQTAATNEFRSFYMYDPSRKQFVADPLLKNLSMPEFDSSSKSIKTFQTGGCAGQDFEESVYSFKEGKYVLTLTKEAVCCELDGSDSDLEVRISELKNGRMQVVRTEECPGN